VPKKGDDFGVITASVGINHCFNAKAIFSTKEFAEIHGSSGSNQSREFNGIFDKTFVVISDTESYSPVFDCETVNVLDASHGAVITVTELNGTITVYTVRGVKHNAFELGKEMTRLILEVVL